LLDYYSLFRNIAFKLDAELAHERSISFLSKCPRLGFSLSNQNKLDDKYSLKLNNGIWKFPVGLAAGLDKNADCIDYFSRINFGAVEVGTVTPLSQPGNGKPRLFRYPDKKSLRNCMGFNNDGMDHMAQKIQLSNKNKKILGVNLGKNKATTSELAWSDYVKLFEKFRDIADYLVINVSSPNTPGLRNLQSNEELTKILSALTELRSESSTPLYLKISPDLELDDLSDIVLLAKKFNLAGIIATNTTIISAMGAGGVSGRLLTDKARIVRNSLLELLKDTPEIDLIGVGGINSFEQLWDFWKHGGKVIQIYTSFIYQGPAILNNIKNNIDKVLVDNNLSSLQELLENINEISLKCN
jgi:dihydroorotate dehydrogenase